MLTHSKAFSSFAVNDLTKAKHFYGELLGIAVKEDEMGLLELHLGDGMKVIIYPKENHTAASFTILNFTVENIEETVDKIIAQGIVFEHYNEPYLQTDSKGICRGKPNIAWFKDPAGNLLSVIEN